MKNLLSKTTISFLSLIAVSGCAQNTWFKQGANSEEFNSDRYACERDARQSGYFGGGLVGSINMQNFFNQCLNSKGWSLKNKKQALEEIEAQKNIISNARLEEKNCKIKIREKTKYYLINSRFSDMDTGRYSFEQMSSDQIPTVKESDILKEYFSEVDDCLTSYKSSVYDFMNENQKQSYDNVMENENNVAAELVRRKISYGEFSTQENKYLDELKKNFKK